MTEVGDLICRWVIPCARRIAERHDEVRNRP
jgi:hypothetical protein